MNAGQVNQRILAPKQQKLKNSFGLMCFTDVDLYTDGMKGFVYGVAFMNMRTSMQSIARN